jgi:hypothetical protein
MSLHVAASGIAENQSGVLKNRKGFETKSG